MHRPNLDHDDTLNGTVADVASTFLRLAGLPPTPICRAVFEAYVEGHVPALNEVISEALWGGQPIGVGDCEALFKRYLAPAGATNWRGPVAVVEGGPALDRIRALERELEATLQQVDELRRRLVQAEVNAGTDPLTGIANRRRFEEVLEASLALTRHRGEPLALIMADVDRFKAFNDRYGHYTGDHVLRLVAAAFERLPEPSGFVARYGGEEFAALLPGVAADRALQAADHVRCQLAERRIVMRHSGETIGSITISAGVAQARYGEGPGDLVRRADGALYRAKRAGRNCVVVGD